MQFTLQINPNNSKQFTLQKKFVWIQYPSIVSDNDI